VKNQQNDTFGSHETLNKINLKESRDCDLEHPGGNGRNPNKSDPRRYEIDALRVIALALLIIYHVFASYQPFANSIRFIQYDQELSQYWFVAELFNVWRIPILFVISGMAIGFVLRRRSVKEVVADRMMRLVPPLAFGSFFFCPAYLALHSISLNQNPTYEPNPGHLWFVWNLVTYSILSIPLILYFKRHPENFVIRTLRATFPFGLLVFLPLPLMLETVLSKPWEFAFFPIRFWYGLVCYAAGFVLVSTGEKFWNSLTKVCHFALPLAILCYLGRMEYLDWELLRQNHSSTAFESGMWMLALLGYGSLFLNKPTNIFTYLSKAVFPIYVIHMPVQQLLALVVFPWALAPSVTFLLHVVLTLLLCGVLYEFVIRRIGFLYPVMGLKKPKRPCQKSELSLQKDATNLWGRRLTLFVLSPVAVLAQVGILVAVYAGHLVDETKPDYVPSKSLWTASKNNDVPNIEKFLEKGEASVDQLDPEFKLSALQTAALNGSEKAVESLIQAGADVNLQTEDRSTALSHAALMGHSKVVELLLNNKANINPVNAYQSTPLDNTYAPWAIVLPVSKMLELTVEREKWEKGRIQARNLLLKEGAKHAKEL